MGQAGRANTPPQSSQLKRSTIAAWSITAAASTVGLPFAALLQPVVLSLGLGVAEHGQARQPAQLGCMHLGKRLDQCALDAAARLPVVDERLEDRQELGPLPGPPWASTAFA